VTPWYLGTAPAPSSVLAVLTTAHVALALIRKHRAGTAARGRLLASVALAFAASPWIFPRPRDLAIGLAAHFVWFAISSPASRGYLEISVKRQGLVSSTLHATIRPGSVLSIRPPAGAFVYPEGDDRPLVLVSGGVGCTPMISMLRHAVACEPSRAVVYLFSAKGESDIAFRQELALLGRRHPQVRIVVALTRGEANPRFYAGRIDEKLIRQVVPDPAQSLFYVCGPQGMIQGIRTLLGRIGVPPAQVRSEAFEAAVAASRVPPGAESPAPEPVAVVAQVGATGGGRTSVRLSVSGKTVCPAGGQTLLEAAETARVEIASSCRSGVCGTCRTRLVSGEVECSADAMDESDREQGYIYPCVAWAKGDCVLEA
jgi:ferredoxin-NADP reductase